MAEMRQTRRAFLGSAAAAGAGISLALSNAGACARALGANDRISLAFAGVRSRGRVLIDSALASGGDSVRVHALCDVDSNVLTEQAAAVTASTGRAPRTVKDFRRLLDDKDIDAVVIATPDHTHAPFAIHAMQAGKHVYVEKPCSHNPYEGELLVRARNRYGRIVQMGNQQRSAPTSIEAISDIRDGMIGRPYLGKAWYSNTRGGIGRGAESAVPEWLDWELWQGPAPRRAYRDNVVHYNWHWFRHWGTGEINNNGLHEIDICRWALDAGYPQRVTSAGGRYHFDDDWEFYDTQIASFEFAGGRQITWEGRSCNGFAYFGRGRGATIHGTEGTVLLDRNGYFLYDHDGKLIKQMNERGASGTTDPVGEGALDGYHLRNFFAAIRDGETLHSPIDDGHKSTLLCHLGNIAQHVGRSLRIDAGSGHIEDDREAMALWRRTYAPGWE
ncbi:MAG: Gfo/Idh/MocA family protein, partial [Woeseiaceae bacterium]